MKKPIAKKFTPYQSLANEICKEFQKRGFICYWVGGAVRDMLLDKENFDIDLATSATPPQVKNLLKKKGFKIYEVGEKFGTIGAVTKHGEIEITTFRTESAYSDKRHPDKVKFAGTAAEDSGRRDFTINALYYDPIAKKILDYHKGQQDLEEKQIRFIGSAEKRIKEDPLRLLRAVRFAANLDFKIAAKDLAAIKKNVKLISKISAERIKNELDKIFSDHNFVQGVLLLDKIGLLKELFPEVDNLKRVKQSKDYHAEGSAFNHSINALRHAKDFDLTLRYAALLHDTGKKFTAKKEIRKGREHVSFHGHAQKSAELFNSIAKRLRFPRRQHKKIHWLLTHHMDLLQPELVTEKTLVKWAKNPDFGDLIRLRAADSMGGIETDPLGKVKAKDNSALKKLYSKWQKFRELSQKNFVTGNDVMKELKIKPGKHVGYVLDRIKREQIFGRIKNKKDALKFIKRVDRTK
jgi:tRNA nucleotidyltransferase (CCA-adding enzyme)